MEVKPLKDIIVGSDPTNDELPPDDLFGPVDPNDHPTPLQILLYGLKRPVPKELKSMGRFTTRDWAEWDAEHEGDYHGSHTAPSAAYGDPMHALGSGVLPEDIYDKSTQLKYYGTGDDKSDKESFAVVNTVKDNPDAPVDVYRAVPAGVQTINPGDWVTPSKTYALQHALSGWGGDGGPTHVISQTVTAKELYTNGDSINEWGYHPSESGK